MRSDILFAAPASLNEVKEACGDGLPRGKVRAMKNRDFARGLQGRMNKGCEACVEVERMDRAHVRLMLARCYADSSAGANLVSANVIPAAQLPDADAEAVCDGAECVSAADAIEGSG